MAVRIRLARVGRKHVPMYRVVAIDKKKKRDGQALDIIGTYNALNGTLIQFHEDLYDKWIKCGAQPSDTVKKVYGIFKKKGLVDTSPKKKNEPLVSKKENPKKEKVEKTEKTDNIEAKKASVEKSIAKKTTTKKASEKKEEVKKD